MDEDNNTHVGCTYVSHSKHNYYGLNIEKVYSICIPNNIYIYTTRFTGSKVVNDLPIYRYQSNDILDDKIRENETLYPNDGIKLNLCRNYARRFRFDFVLNNFSNCNHDYLFHMHTLSHHEFPLTN